MEILAMILPLLAFILPVAIMFIIYAGVLALVVWFVITFLKNQRERNRLLADISTQLKNREDTQPKESPSDKEL